MFARAVLEAVEPGGLVRERFPRDLRAPVKLLSIGKASVAMARAAADELGPTLAGGVVIAIPERAATHEAAELERLGLDVLPADHPLPRERNIAAAREAERLVRAIGPGETLLALVSGGGSAQLALPRDGITLDEVVRVSNALMRVGATIRELNAVRKHLERLKGGQLGAMCRGTARVLVLSDVVGDSLDVIASGPFAPDPTTFADALGVLHTRGVAREFAGIASFLEVGRRGASPETPKPGDPALARITHEIIGNNTTAIEAAVAWARSRGWTIERVDTGVEGEAGAIAGRLAEWACARAASGQVGAPPVAVVLGGEPTVTVGGASGLGGPSQELALAFAREAANVPGVMLIALSTDGRDGPTDAAGAVVTGRTWADAAQVGIDPSRALAGHDAYHALDRLGALIRTGPTGTNVNHVALAVVRDAEPSFRTEKAGDGT